jgi:hypothetical protein
MPAGIVGAAGSPRGLSFWFQRRVACNPDHPPGTEQLMASRRQGVGRLFTEKNHADPAARKSRRIDFSPSGRSPLRVPRPSARRRPRSKSKTASDYNGLLLDATILDEIHQSPWGRVGTLL